MISLENSKKFQEEYTSYRKRIDRVDNQRVKAELESLMEKLITEIRAIDKQHYQLAIKNTLPEITQDYKHRSAEYRRKIVRLLDDYEKAKSNT